MRAIEICRLAKLGGHVERCHAAFDAGRLVMADTLGIQFGVGQTRTHLYRQSNRSLSEPPISAGKRVGEARDWAAIFADDGLFRATETGFSRVSPAKASGS
jgi:hypothetical protein